jgi:arylsulfatase A-like enzyme
MRQCKKSIFEGGLRVPTIVHAPFLIRENANLTSPFGSVDVLPTVMDLLQAPSSHPAWAMDGISMLPFLTAAGAGAAGEREKEQERQRAVRRPAEHPLTFWYLNTSGIIDNQWKLVHSPELGVRNCPVQPPYDAMVTDQQYFLFNLDTDIHEMHDLKHIEVDIFNRLRNELNEFKVSANYSQHFETGCAPGAVPGGDR